MAKTKLEVNNLRLSFWTNNGTVKAVRDISFDVKKGETLAIVGESGSGKSVTSRAIMGILAPNAIVESGEIYFEGMDLLQISESDYNKLRGNRISMIFQDPLSSLNPITRVGEQITEAMIANNKSRKRSATSEIDRVESAIKEVAKETGKEAEANQYLKTYKEYLSKGHKSSGEYSDSRNALETLSKQIRYTLLDLQGDIVYEDLMDKIKALEKDSKEIYHDFTVSEKNSSIAKWIGEAKELTKNFKPLAKEYEKAQAAYLAEELSGDDKKLHQSSTKLREVREKVNLKKDEISELLRKVQAESDEILAEPSPDFLVVGYALSEGKVTSLANEYTEVKEAELSKELHSKFLDKFADFLAVLQKHENSRVNDVLSLLISDLDKEIDKLQENFDLDYLLNRRKDIINAVNSSISRLEITRDSFAHTFEGALNAQLENFENLRKNRKQVKALSDNEKVALKETYVANCRRLFDRLVNRLNAKYESKHDEKAEAIEILQYLNEQTADATYTLNQKLAEARAIDLLDEVGIPEPRKRFRQYPFQFSGGMRQRVVIAIALSSNPDLLICDEPTTALDVTIQAQILDLIKDLKEKRNFSVIFITHDLGVVANIADKIAVMYAGKIVEYGGSDEIFYDPKHPYTWGLLSSMPDLETKETLISIPGVPPNMINPPQGDAFAARNRYALAIDFEQHPPFFKVSDTHEAATWLLHEKAPKVEPPRIVTERINRMTKAIEEFNLLEREENEEV